MRCVYIRYKMASLVETPVKENTIDCAFCLSNGISVSFNLNGRKCSDFNLLFAEFVGNNSYDDYFKEIKHRNESICRNCFHTFVKFVCFKRSVVENVKTILSGYRRSEKRMSNFSPPDGKSLPHEETRNTTGNIDEISTNGQSLQQENIFSTGKMITVGATTPEMSGKFGEHDYCISKKRAKFQKELFPAKSVVKDRLKHNLEDGNESSLLKEIKQEICAVSTKEKGKESLLYKEKRLLKINDNQSFFADIYEEMSNRTPLFLDVISTCLDKDTTDNQYQRIIGAIVTIYSIILFSRNPEINAFQRMLTVICIRGRAEDMLFSRLNKIGLTLCARSKLRLLEEASEMNQKEIVKYLKQNPLLKITGDNLDIFIRTGNQAIDIRNKDLHLFASNAISTRIAKPDMDTTQPAVDTDAISGADMFLTDAEFNTLQSSYIILVARILSQIKAFSWMKSVIPTHIHHNYSASMGQRNEVFSMPIIHKNESKYEECIDIMDTLENSLQLAFRDAHGNLEMLEKYKVVTGGDQLTKVRFDGAANLRLLSPTAAGRLDHLSPRICELWHLKQDFLEKCFKTLYKTESQRQEGTLSYFKNILKKNNVTGKVKGKFQSHSDFLKMITVCLIQEQAMELFGMESRDDTPNIIPEEINKMSKSLKEKLMRQVITLIIEKYDYLSEVENLPQNIEDHDHDELYNYCCNLCAWGLHLMQLDDTAKEGDISRVVPNLKICLPFFYCHSNRSKYLEQAVDYICKTQYLLSPIDKIRVLEGSFINLKGGIGNNIEADLVQEHSVREQKDLIKGLGANKSENSISVVTAAASAVTAICTQFDESFSVSKVSTRHTTKSSKMEYNIIQEVLRRTHPFKYQSGRKCAGFQTLKSNPCNQIKLNCMLSDFEMVLERVLQGYITVVEDVEDEIQLSDEEEIPELP